MRVGLYGGTFNPIHYGHLRSAEAIADRIPLDRILFIVAATPPHKDNADLARAEHRLQMIKLAIAGEPRFIASDIELERPGKSYSIDTLHELRARAGARSALYLILGIDAFEEIDTWKDYESLFGLCHFVVTSRPGVERRPLADLIPPAVLLRLAPTPGEEVFTHSAGTTVSFEEVPPVDISATRIREAVRKGESTREWVPDSVRQYIESKRLYKH